MGKNRRVSQGNGFDAEPERPRAAKRTRPVEEGDPRKLLAAAEEEVEKARAEAREAQDRYLRTAAEMENMRRRHREEGAERLRYANFDVISKLLPVLDNFHRALDHAPEEAGQDEHSQQWVSGLQLVVKQMEDILASVGVTSIDAVGEQFDPNLHQAVMSEPAPDADDGEVTEELQKGYLLHGRVLRPSLVKVARND